jgi:FkbM family methyltransferase
MKVDLRSITEWWSFYSGEYDELELLPSISRFLKHDSTILDVGANIGFWTVPLARALRKVGGRCYAFEPIPSNFERLEENVARNELKDLVCPVPIALGEKNDEITMMLDTCHGASTGNAARVPSAEYDAGQREHSPVSVKVRQLDDLAAELGLDQHPCTFIKVDIEGNEPHFLRGAAGFIHRHMPAIMVEINRIWLARNGLSIDDYFQVLSPDRYSTLLWRDRAWTEVSNLAKLDSLMDIETVLFVPRNKAQTP